MKKRLRVIDDPHELRMSAEERRVHKRSMASGDRPLMVLVDPHMRVIPGYRSRIGLSGEPELSRERLTSVPFEWEGRRPSYSTSMKQLASAREDVSSARKTLESLRKGPKGHHTPSTWKRHLSNLQAAELSLKSTKDAVRFWVNQAKEAKVRENIKAKGRSR